jgi:glycosyltransferase involved in cell wall biosynthesis
MPGSGAVSRIIVPVTVTARDEERPIGKCLDSLLAAARFAEARHAITIDLAVVLDDCRDRTAAIVADRGIRTLTSTGGKVAAQRTALRGGPFHVFSDADILIEENTLAALCEAMLGDPSIDVAFPAKLPLPGRRRTPLAHALYIYNTRRGFSSQRAWFSGKLFAIRNWTMPHPDDIVRRAHDLPASRFYDYAAPLRVDDIYLSRHVKILRETAGLIWFRAPATWRSMYRYYRRMRREIERIDALYPESPAPPPRVPDLLKTAPLSEQAAWHVFQLALAGCRIAYHAERFACDCFGLTPADPWPTLAETKVL